MEAQILQGGPATVELSARRQETGWEGLPFESDKPGFKSQLYLRPAVELTAMHFPLSLRVLTCEAEILCYLPWQALRLKHK